MRPGVWASASAVRAHRESTDSKKGVEMGLNSLKDVLTEQLQDLYSAETQLVTALPKMESTATYDELKTAFREHLQETKGHVKRCEEALGELGASPGTEECKGMKGLI